MKKALLLAVLLASITAPAVHADVSLYEPYQPKLVGTLPAGWKLELLNTAQIAKTQVKLESGETVTLSIAPYEIKPDLTIAKGIYFVEPGFDPRYGNQQTTTIGAILTSQIEQTRLNIARLQSANDGLANVLAEAKK